jgi:hypothetical protein
MKGMKKGKWLIFGLMIFLAAIAGSGQIHHFEAARQSWPDLKREIWPEPVQPGQRPKIPGYQVNQIIAELRVDTPEVRRSRHWSQALNPGEPIDNHEGRNFTAAWFSLNIGSCPHNSGCGFTQAGFLENKDNLNWFVYSNLPLDCDYGQKMWSGKGCMGTLRDLFGDNVGRYSPITGAPDITVHFWRTRQGYWVIQFETWVTEYYPEPRSYLRRYDVAFIQGHTDDEVTRATSTFEHIFKDTSSGYPAQDFAYDFVRPKYLKGSGFAGPMVPWPASAKNGPLHTRNRLFTYSSGPRFCPEFYRVARWNGGWTIGNVDGVCNIPRLF